MTYTEWRDELKSNLLCVSESERRRVLDYYAEAYADRREAGFSEREIITDFGAPYDAAQRILSENKNDGYNYGVPPEPPLSERRQDTGDARRNGQFRREQNNYAPPPPPPQPQPQPAPAYAYAGNAPAAAKTEDNSWILVVLCIIFAVPLCGLIMTMVGITIGFCVAPIAVIGAGTAAVGSAIGSIIGGETVYGLYLLGGGIIVMGIGIILCPIFFKLVGLMWKLFTSFFSWLKSLFGGRSTNK